MGLTVAWKRSRFRRGSSSPPPNSSPNPASLTHPGAPGVREVAVVGAPRQRWGEETVAVVSVQPKMTFAAEVGHRRESLAGSNAQAGSLTAACPLLVTDPGY
jgi:hypothetical protein